MRKINQYIQDLNLNKTKELIIAIVSSLIILALGILLYFFVFPNIFVLITIILVAICEPFLYFGRYPNMYKRLMKSREVEFVNLMGYYRIYLSHGYNTYQSFEKIIPLASLWLQEKIAEFLNQVNEDKSVEPYIAFASIFSNDSVRQLLISIYQISVNGYVDHFFTNFMNINKNLESINESNYYENYKNTHKNVSIAPLLAAGLFTIVLTIGILQVVGGVISGF